MQGTSGLTGAAPIWADFMNTAIQQVTGGNPSPFIKPAGVIERVICSVSGTEPSQWCPTNEASIFQPTNCLFQKDMISGKKRVLIPGLGILASVECSGFAEEKTALNVTEKWGVRWIKETDQGKNWASSIGFKDPIFFTPSKSCIQGDSRPLLSFASLDDGQVITTKSLGDLWQGRGDFRFLPIPVGIWFWKQSSRMGSLR